MSDNTLSSNSGPASAEAPIPRAHLARDPATVVNPERRGGPHPDDSANTPASSLVRTLFPAAEAPVPLDDQSDLMLGHFRVVERIRTGGMGAVFRAVDTRLNRVVAIKILPPAQTRDPGAVLRFKNEAQAAAQLDHENIARVYYIGEDQGLHFIAFEFVHGTNVRDLIAQQGQISVEDAVNYTLQIASALAHTSAHGVVHRDIKPSNVIITRNSRAKLVDLGLARNENSEQGVDLTAPGTTLGTFDYISPEQAYDPRSADVRSDLYSLGCTLYHMLTGEPPYPEGTVMQKLLQHKGDDAPSASSRNRRVPENLSVVCRRMMAKEPRRRHQSAEELMQDLMLVAGSLGLRSVSPEGLVWISSSAARTPFWERHLAWMGTLATLVVIIAILQFRPPNFAPRSESLALNTATAPSPDSSNIRRPQQGSDTPTPDPQTQTKPAETVQPESTTETSKPEEKTETTLPPPEDSNSVARLLADASGGFSLQPALETGSSARIGPDPLSTQDLTAVGPASVEGEPVEPAPKPQTTAEATSPVERPTSPPAAAPESIWMISRGMGQAYANLAAACAQAEDGAVIELRYNGVREEGPIRITKKISIVAARGVRPGIAFSSRNDPTGSSQARMITVAQGALELVGVDLQLTVDPNVPADLWCLFSLSRPETLRMKGVTLTIRNPRQVAAAVIELPLGSATSMPEMNMQVMTRPPLEVDISGCFIRGTADLVLSRNLDPVRISVAESIVALQGALLHARGDQAGKVGEERIDLRLEHVTASLGSGLLKLDGGSTPRRFLPVQVTASNSIFTTGAGAALVHMQGAAPTTDFRRLLVWNGRKNFYDQYATFWSITSADTFGVPETMDFRAWQRVWGPTAEVDPRAEPVIWRHYWENRPPADLYPSDFALDRSPNNPAVSGATTRNDAGADLDGLLRLGISVQREPAQP